MVSRSSGVGGGKLDYATELAVAEALNAAESAVSNDFQEFEIDESAEHDYAHHLRSLVPADFSSLHIVLDCANGAASHVAHEIFESTGARITTIHDDPNGRNINVDSGSTHIHALVAKVTELHADLGLAFDGDADRLIAVDAGGTVRDGDDLMILFARDFFERNELGGGLVVTSMSNLGLHRSMGDFGHRGRRDRRRRPQRTDRTRREGLALRWRTVGSPDLPIARRPRVMVN